jgi:hypothetical protein
MTAWYVWMTLQDCSTTIRYDQATYPHMIDRKSTPESANYKHVSREN